jgi:hypothetical protein
VAVSLYPRDVSATPAEVTAAPVIIPRKLHLWDRRIDYDATRALVAGRIQLSREQAIRNANADGSDLEAIEPTAAVRLLHYERFLTALVSGSRSGEVFAAFGVFLSTGERKIATKVLKTSPACVCGHRKTGTKKDTGHVVLAKGKGTRGPCKVDGCKCGGYVPDEVRRKMREIQIPEEVLDSDRDLINGG